MTKKPVRNDDILAAHHGYQIRISGIRAAPGDTFFDLGFDFHAVAVAIEYFIFFNLGHAVEDRHVQLISLSVPVQFPRP